MNPFLLVFIILFWIWTLFCKG